MASEPKPALVALRDRRDKVIEILSDAFAGGLLEPDAFDERVDLAHRADSVAALDRLVEDVAPIPAAAEAPTAAAAAALAPVAASTAIELQRPEKQSLVAVMGGVERKGTWRVPRRLRVLTVMGGADLDLREARLPPGLTELRVTAIMGGVDIIVPPGLAVEAHGWAIMGGFDGVDRAPAEPDPERPLLRISGFAVMGGISVRTRLPGESGLQAWRRERRERRQLRDQAKKQLPGGDGDPRKK
jgi:hypothetical protein